MVRSDDSDSISILIFLVGALWHTFAVVSWRSSILHELDSALLKCRCTLRSIIHHGEKLGAIGHGEGRVHWVVIGCDVVVRIFQIRIWEIPSWPEVQDSLLHFHAVRVGVEGRIVSEVSKGELGNNLITIKPIVNCWETVEVYIKFDGTLISELHVDNSSSLVINKTSGSIFEVEVPLILSNFCSFLELCVNV